MKILVVDDHALVRAGLRQVLKVLDHEEVEIIEEATGAAALQSVDKHADLDFVLLDINLPDVDGITVLQEIGRRRQDLSVVVLSGSGDRSTMDSAFKHGAAGFIPKSTISDVLISALRLVLAGGIYVPPEMVEPHEANKARSPAKAIPGVAGIELTGRQLEVLGLMLQGQSNKEICRTLHLAEPTVKVHVSAILRALGVNSRTQAVIAASRLGLGVGERI